MFERGTHAELLANGSLYAAFAEEQSAERALLDLDLDAKESAS